MAETIRFFDHFVAGRSAPPAHAVRCALAWDGWSEAESWPPPETAPLTLHLATGTGREGEMSTSPSSQAGSPPLSLRHDPLDPAPSMLDQRLLGAETEAVTRRPAVAGAHEHAAVGEAPDGGSRARRGGAEFLQEPHEHGRRQVLAPPEPVVAEHGGTSARRSCTRRRPRSSIRTSPGS